MLPEKLDDLIYQHPDTPLMVLDDPWLDPYNVRIFIKRDDLIDSRVSGNKLRKLKYALRRYQKSGYSGIISFGGSWSNHLHATSCVAEKYSIPMIAIVRGEVPPTPSATLIDIQLSGTSIHHVSRSDYREFRALAEQERLSESDFIQQWPDYMVIPEGGCSSDAITGVADIITEDEIDFEAIYLACGTGATLAGLAVGLANQPDTRLTGIAALKAGDSLMQNVQRLLDHHQFGYSNNWRINDQFHFGGFAKTTPELIEFMCHLYERTGLISEPVYTGKTLFALYQHIQQGHFAAGSKVMLLHTGGLQGLRGYQNKGLEQLIVAYNSAIAYARDPEL